jgi:hypothetical protein
MSRITKRRPSAAMIVALIALVLAAAGTSAAAGFLSLKDFSKGAKVNTFGVGPLVYSQAQTFVPAGQIRTVGATCPTNTRVIGGGIKVSTGGQVIEGVVDSGPTNNPSGWTGTVSNGGATESHTAIASAICAKTLKAKGTIGGFRVK